MNANAVAQRIETQPMPVSAGVASLMTMIERAVLDPNFDTQKLRELFEVKKQWDAEEARTSYVAAMSEFKSEPINILKTKEVNIPGGAKFSHATLANVVDGVCSSMSKYGLSHKWETKQENGEITVTCVVTHKRGHSERVTLTAKPDDSGKKNSIQQVASTVTYLERYTLMAACGLAAKDMDDDARSAGKKTAPPAPEGYDKWKADIGAVAEEGKERLMTVWKASDMILRAYATTHDGDWWATTKNKAAKVTA